MTNNGSFVVNGTERVIVSQLHRSPGVFFEHDRGKTHSPASCCSRRGSFPTVVPGSTSSSTRRIILYFRVDRRRKMPVTIPAEGHRDDPEEIPATFHDFDTFTLRTELGASFALVPDRLRGEGGSTSATVRQGHRQRTSGSPPSTSANSRRRHRDVNRRR